MTSCQSQIYDFEFSAEEIEEAVKNGRLLSMEIEFSRRCNFRCPYCYVPGNSSLPDELTEEEIRDVILQARELGAKKIIILGGEPMIYPHILRIIKFIREHHLKVEMFTNGSNITADTARRLFEYGVNVALKINTFNEQIQEMLTGIDGSNKIVWETFNNLKQAGYPSPEAALAISTVICRQNIDELAEMWQWMRDRDITPYFEMITPQENAKWNEWLWVEPARVRDLFYRIAAIDRTRYEDEWEPQPPLIGNKCLRHQFSCLVTSQGEVMPCVGVTIPIGNIRKQQLSDIIQESEVIQNLRNFSSMIKGPCRECEKADHCYGCRGAAYQLTGDYLASDPLCWENIDRQDDIISLPASVEGMIPQKPPMRVVDKLIRVGEKKAEVSVRISKEMPFVDREGVLDETVYMEILAQATAAMNGFEKMGSGVVPEGFLLGAKKLKIMGEARVGDGLEVSVYKCAHYGDFGIIKGTVSRGKTVIARGEIKVWHRGTEVRKQKAEDRGYEKSKF